jgi:hypothetical protein
MYGPKDSCLPVPVHVTSDLVEDLAFLILFVRIISSEVAVHPCRYLQQCRSPGFIGFVTETFEIRPGDDTVSIRIDTYPIFRLLFNNFIFYYFI